MHRQPPTSPPFPSPPLFRLACAGSRRVAATSANPSSDQAMPSRSRSSQRSCRLSWKQATARAGSSSSCAIERSEEHTSELQSRQYLVCRLLLEKKKTKKYNL